jgi:hypothetical protein
MAFDPQLGELLTLSALIAATIDYCEVLKRRESQRQWAAERSAAEVAGLQGLVRVFLSEG